MKLAELKRLTAIWQERLRLQNWNLTVRFANSEELQVRDAWAKCNTYPNTREATLWVINPKDYTPEEITSGTHDVEVYIIHELMHLHFTPFCTEENTAEEQAEESIIDLVSRLLIATARGDDKVTGCKLSRKASFKPKAKKEVAAVAEETSNRKEGN